MARVDVSEINRAHEMRPFRVKLEGGHPLVIQAASRTEAIRLAWVDFQKSFPLADLPQVEWVYSAR